MSHPFSREFTWIRPPLAISDTVESGEQPADIMLSSEAAVQQQRILDEQFFAEIAARLKDADEAWLMSMAGNWPGYGPRLTRSPSMYNRGLSQRIAA